MNAYSWQDVVMLIALLLSSFVAYIVANLREGSE